MSLLARGLGIGHRLLGRPATALGIDSFRIRHRDAIVMYHSVRDHQRVRPGTSDITPGEFERHLEYYAREFEVVPLKMLLEPAPCKKRIALTFDDGYRDFYTNVRPLLHEFDVPATVFVISDFVDDIDRKTQVANTGHLFETLTQDQLLELVDDPLVTIGNHSKTHHNLGRHDDSDIIHDEVVSSKSELERLLGTSIECFSYPNGGVNDTSRELVRETHELATLDESMRPLGEHEDPVRLPRIDGGLPFERIRWYLSDANAELVGLTNKVFGYPAQ